MLIFAIRRNIISDGGRLSLLNQNIILFAQNPTIKDI